MLVKDIPYPMTFNRIIVTAQQQPQPQQQTVVGLRLSNRWEPPTTHHHKLKTT